MYFLYFVLSYIVWPCQIWQLRGGIILEPEEGKVYKIINVFSGKVLEVNDFKCKNGTNVRQWDFDDKPPNKLWLFQPTGDGYYKITSLCCRGKFLEIESQECRNGGDARIWEWDSKNHNKQWKIIEFSNGEIALEPRHCPSHVLEVEDSSPAKGANIRLWMDNGEKNKRWKIEPYTGE